MKSKKLEKWASLLLDTGKRNNLINYTDLKTSTLEIIFPEPEKLFSKVDSDASFEIYIPEENSDSKEDRKEYFIKICKEHLKRAKNKVGLYNEKDNPLKALRNIDKRANAYLEETGNNVAFIAFGFVYWKEKGKPEEYRAPILLTPIIFRNESAVSPWFIQMTGDDTILNPTFMYKLETEYKISLPEYAGETLEEYFDIVSNVIQKLGWKVVNECKIGLFQFAKMNMYKDIINNENTILKNRHIKEILGEPCEKSSSESECLQECEEMMLTRLHNVIDADNSQIEAIKMAKAGESFVLQGPPGTGKSQTITNIIAELLSDGKKILFVSEKQAALNVVYDKLKQAELDEFCLELHSHKANKKQFVEELCRTIQTSKTTISIKAEEIIKKENSCQKMLNQYYEELHRNRESVGKSLFQMYENFYLYSDARQIPFRFKELERKDSVFFDEAVEVLQRYVDMTYIVGEKYMENAWYGFIELDTSTQNTENKKEIISKAVNCYHKLNEIRTHILQESYGFRIRTVHSLECSAKVFDFALENNYISEKLFSKESCEKVKIELAIIRENGISIQSYLERMTSDCSCMHHDFEMVREGTREIITIFKGIHEIQNKLRERYNVVVESILLVQEIRTIIELYNRLCEMEKPIVDIKCKIDANYQANIYGLDGAKMHSALVEGGSHRLHRLFDSDYKEKINRIGKLNIMTGKVSYEQAIVCMRELAEYQRRAKEFSAIENAYIQAVKSACEKMRGKIEPIENGIQMWECMMQEVGWGKKICEMSHDCYNKNKKLFQTIAAAVRDNVEQANGYKAVLEKSFDKKVLDFNGMGVEEILQKLFVCDQKKSSLASWIRFCQILRKLEVLDIKKFVDISIKSNVPPHELVNAFKHCYYKQWIEKIFNESEVLPLLDRRAHDRKREQFIEFDRALFDISKARIRSELSEKRPTIDAIAPGSSTSMILREGQKKRKIKSIRKLMAEAGSAIQNIKPCFLMSPLSVSTYLDANGVKFDTAIFDEASQIFPQDAVGAIYRANQIIVVGDSKQMPPSNFFLATSADEENDEEEVGDIADFESILDICAGSMKQLRLSWHYRSKFEELIAFSNRYFYDGDLVTFPETKMKEKWFGVDFHFVKDGVYDRKKRVNWIEAEYIVSLIYKNFEMFPNRSLGVVAFSLSQQEMIERLLTKKRVENPDMESFFSRERKEPFFIKNLETVQGDERDTIIFSIGYGKDANGKFLHNFGPLNRQGGERRLNVAVTRAKENIQMVASIHYYDIQVQKTVAEGAKLLREYLKYAENGIRFEEKVKRQEREVCSLDNQICDYLRENGYEADVKKGESNFKIDICVKHPNKPEYLLAIMEDGEAHYGIKNSRDRERLQNDVLKSRGWSCYQIWSTDWYNNLVDEKTLLLEAVKNAKKDEEIRQPFFNNQKTKNVFVDESTKEKAFAEYVLADIEKLYAQGGSFLNFVRNVLMVEAPLSKDWFLRRIVEIVFGKTKVTSKVKTEFEHKLFEEKAYGICSRDGFLYLKGQAEFKLRKPSDTNSKRKIQDIAIEELAEGLQEVIQQSATVRKEDLYHKLIEILGFQKLTDKTEERLDQALNTIKKSIVVKGDLISMKK
ncbi:Part of AAA domain-containing protein [Lachnospiraceae bacterium XBB1006]|nr:Part of AAA domain-containing protein [Lachnospiraceae bacterium XBB1006]